MSLNSLAKVLIRVANLYVGLHLPFEVLETEAGNKAYKSSCLAVCALRAATLAEPPEWGHGARSDVLSGETVQKTFEDATEANLPVKENKLFLFLRGQRMLTCIHYRPGHPFLSTISYKESVVKRTALLTLLLIASFLIAAAPLQNTAPPPEPVKLIFIHHSTGENWLTDGYGDLGRTLDDNNYFVSDTNYGWGPNGIGDRTDIPNWTEWFASDQTPTYMDALFNESGQNADYTRSLADPGGENQIIMFKSCFPNSDLAGSPNDPPGDYEDLSVSGAKYVYNTILEYFASRPDKLFIVITAPPLSDPTHAANARAFNNWLKNEWLAGYTGTNVAVFDFYDVLTGGSGDTLAYPSDDDHPNPEGSRLATAAFIPVLNAAYNRWQAGDTSAPPVGEPAPTSETESQPEAESPVTTSASGLIDNFEGAAPAGSSGWQPYADEHDAANSMVCAPVSDVVHRGANALRMDYTVTPYAWATCHLEYDAPQNWSATEGISFYAYAPQTETPFHVDLFVEGESYVYEGRVEGSDSWQEFVVFWDEFHRVEWEENAGAPFAKPEAVTALAFGFEGGEETLNGTLYIDDLMLDTLTTGQESSTPEAETSENEPEAQPATPETTESRPQGSPLSCIGNVALPLGLIGFAFFKKKKTP